METSLHRQLKALYAPDLELQEVRVDGYRIDAVDGDRLIEIQYGSLGAIRQKVRKLLDTHDVLVVKPLAARKLLVKKDEPGGEVTSSRYSPKRQTLWNVFEDLVHFVDVFPHPRLELEVLLTEQEEHRLPGERKRWVSRGYVVEDRLLQQVIDSTRLCTAADLAEMVPAELHPPGRSEPFTTGDLADAAGIDRWLARKAAYCLRRCGAADVVGKRGNAVLYELNAAV